MCQRVVPLLYSSEKYTSNIHRLYVRLPQAMPTQSSCSKCSIDKDSAYSKHQSVFTKRLHYQQVYKEKRPGDLCSFYPRSVLLVIRRETDHRPITLTYSPLPLPSNLNKNVKNGEHSNNSEQLILTVTKRSTEPNCRTLENMLGSKTRRLKLLGLDFMLRAVRHKKEFRTRRGT